MQNDDVIRPTPGLVRARVEAAWPLAVRHGLTHPLVAGLGLAQAPPADRRLPVSALDALWDALIDRDGPAAPLAMAAGVRASSYGLLTYLLGCAPSGQHALRRLGSAYRDLLSEGTDYRVSVDRRHVEIDVELRGESRSSAATVFAAASVVGFVAAEVEGAPRPVHVQLQREAPVPRAASEFGTFFGPGVHYGAARSRVVYAREDLERRMHGSDPRLAEILEHAARERRTAPRPTAEALHELLLACPRPGSTSQADAAASLGLSPRSLRRRLAEEGTGYGEVLDRVRARFAQAELQVPGVRVATVAASMGYADAAAFRRAFRRWTGASPAAWAKAMRRDR